MITNKRKLLQAGWLLAGLLWLALGAGCATSQGDTSQRVTTMVTRGPYLQMATSSSIVVRWRTDQITDSVVLYGLSLDNLSSVTSSSALTTEHEVTLSGLSPDTRYYYSVGSSGQTLSGGDIGHFFATAQLLR